MPRIAPPVDDRTYDWIIDVLSDLRTFSHANGLHKLASELEDVTLLAAAEISTRKASDMGRRATTRH
ncbi:MAG: hypothetical protein ACU0AU_08530 [Cognatishimia activa]